MSAIVSDLKLRPVCLICMESEESNKNPIIAHIVKTKAEKVFHRFHEECIKDWLAISKTCPECRRKIRLNTSARTIEENADQDLFLNKDVSYETGRPFFLQFNQDIELLRRRNFVQELRIFQTMLHESQ